MTRILVSTFLLFAACNTAADLDQPERRPLGKADNVGSCAESDCDGPAPYGSCWCDDACVEFGDCCSDRVETCEAPADKMCGGFGGLQCGAGEYCDLGAGEGCALADAAGVCRTVPEVCIEVFAPVCGCDGQTYPNSCHAAAAGASVLHEGECGEPEPEVCGGFAGLQCGAGEYCDYPESAGCGFADDVGTCAPRPEACIQVFDPVCGCDGQTYSNACMAAASGASVASVGACQ